MLLSDGDIRAELKAGDLRIDPLGDDQIQPASIDLRLDGRLRAHKFPYPAVVDPEDPEPDLTAELAFAGTGGFVLRTGMFVLASTLETVTLPAHLAAQIDGKSTLARLGIVVHSTAGWVDPGFSGQLTLEMSNQGPLPVKLTAGMRIGQLCIFRCSSPAERPYGSAGLGSRYQGQQGPTPARAPGS